MNPWTWYILNDEMPEIDFEDFPFKKLFMKLFICFLVVIIWAVVVFCIVKYAVGFNNEYFLFWFLSIFFVSIAILVFLIVKIFEKI